jgi:phage terminase small subunit
MIKDALTQKQENFCLNIVSGMTQREAWVKAGYSSKYDIALIDTHASVLASTDKVKKRIAELRDKAADSTIMSVIERKQRLSEIARGKTVDFIDKHGNINTEAENNAAIAEITVEESLRDTRTKRIKLHNPVQAMDLLNKMEHVYEDKTVINDIKILIVREGDKRLHLPEGDE